MQKETCSQKLAQCSRCKPTWSYQFDQPSLWLKCHRFGNYNLQCSLLNKSSSMEYQFCPILFHLNCLLSMTTSASLVNMYCAPESKGAAARTTIHLTQDCQHITFNSTNKWAYVMKERNEMYFKTLDGELGPKNIVPLGNIRQWSITTSPSPPPHPRIEISARIEHSTSKARHEAITGNTLKLKNHLKADSLQSSKIFWMLKLWNKNRNAANTLQVRENWWEIYLWSELGNSFPLHRWGLICWISGISDERVTFFSSFELCSEIGLSGSVQGKIKW